MMTIAFVVVFVLFAGFILRKAIEVSRTKAMFKLFAARDDLVYLVASGKLSEESPVFSFYYDRLNSLLKAAPNVGIDDVLRGILNYGGDAEFEKAFQAAQERRRILLEDPSMKSAAVRSVISDFYDGVRFLILIHSRAVTLAYFAMPFGSFGVRAVEGHHLPRRTGNALKTFEMADSEVRHLRSGLCNASG